MKKYLLKQFETFLRWSLTKLEDSPEQETKCPECPECPPQIICPEIPEFKGRVEYVNMDVHTFVVDVEINKQELGYHKNGGLPQQVIDEQVLMKFTKELVKSGYVKTSLIEDSNPRTVKLTSEIKVVKPID